MLTVLLKLLSAIVGPVPAKTTAMSVRVPAVEAEFRVVAPPTHTVVSAPANAEPETPSRSSDEMALFTW